MAKRIPLPEPEKGRSARLRWVCGLAFVLVAAAWWALPGGSFLPAPVFGQASVSAADPVAVSADEPPLDNTSIPRGWVVVPEGIYLIVSPEIALGISSPGLGYLIYWWDYDRDEVYVFDRLAMEKIDLGRAAIAQRRNLASFSHPHDPPDVVVEYDGHIVMPLLHRDFVDGDAFEPLVLGLAESLGQRLLVELLDGLGVQIEVVRDRFHGQSPATQFGRVGAQSHRDPLAGIHEVQPLDVDTSALPAAQLAVFNVKEHRVIAEVSIAHELTGPGMEAAGLPALVAQRTETTIRRQLHERALRFVADALTDHPHSTPREVSCYTEVGHRVSPAWLDGVFANHYLTAEKPVSTCFSGRQTCNFFGGEPFFSTGLQP